jgi:hypothetical protein
MVMKQTALRGDLVITKDEHDAITKIIRPRSDGTLPPGYVTLVVTAEDRLYRYRDGVARVLYEVPGGHEELCMAFIHTCPIVETQSEHTTLSRYCFKGQELEWWIILPGARMMFIVPPEPLKIGREVIIVFEIMDVRRPQPSELLVPFRAGSFDVSIRGAP